MPGFGQTATVDNVLSGNAVAAMIGDQVMFFAQTAGHQYPFGTEQLYGIGSSLPQEVQQFRVSPQISLDSYSLTPAGVAALQGGNNLNYLLAGNQFDLHIYNGVTNTIQFTYVGCKCQNFSESIPANAPVRDTYSFLAMDVLNAAGVSILNTLENALTIGVANVAGALNTIGLSTQ